ncbi:MAG: RES family NAD+ phosphorylase [Actinomycetota bacterium]|nr:RES family NAD+ phosphorylase [Actinomycetota bacterium]
MPDYLPPPNYSDTPHRYLLPTDTMLWRVHRQKDEPTDFTKYHGNRRFQYGRFAGSAADPYATWHASQDIATILADILLRSTQVSPTGYRMVRRVAVTGQRASALSTLMELELVSLRSAPDLAAVAQDVWLIHAEDIDDPMIRRWASWIRSRATSAVGFIWPPRLASQHHLVVLFGDRCSAGLFDPEPITQIDLDDESGAAWLNWVLRPYRARINPPRAPRQQ